MYIGSPCLVFLFRLLSLRNHEAMVLRRGGGGGGGGDYAKKDISLLAMFVNI